MDGQRTRALRTGRVSARPAIRLIGREDVGHWLSEHAGPGERAPRPSRGGYSQAVRGLDSLTPHQRTVYEIDREYGPLAPGEIHDQCVDTVDYRKQYVGVLGSATAQQLIRKIKSAWKSFFSLKEKGERCFPPGYLANEDDGRTLRIYICNDQHTRTGKPLTSRNPRREETQREVRPRLHRAPSSRSSGRSEMGRQTGSAQTALRRVLEPIQDPSVRHRGRFSPEFTAGFGRSRAGYWCEQPRRLYDRGRPTVPLRRTWAVQPVPRHNARDCPATVGTLRGAIPSNRIRQLYR
ncbi:MAG: putative transposase [uncultured archaeon A07HB70]|nr:MAG: putative transposase [uncultured archaeon A07HB70]